MSVERFRDFRFIVVVALFCFAFSISASAQKPPDYTLTGSKIVNFSQYDHTFKDVTDDDSLEYWNTMGTSVIVSAIVTGPKDSYVTGREVEIKVYDGAKLFKTTVGRVGHLRSGTYYVPIVLYAPHCRPLRIEARLLGQKKISSISKRIDFACGE